MRIAELEQRTGVSRDTLRYYEREGLLKEVSRQYQNNYRDYPEKAVDRVQMVRQFKALGFTLKEIREVLDALRTNSIDCAQGAELMAEKQELVVRKIRELESVHQMLDGERRRLLESAERQRRAAPEY